MFHYAAESLPSVSPIVSQCQIVSTSTADIYHKYRYNEYDIPLLLPPPKTHESKDQHSKHCSVLPSLFVTYN